MRLSFNLIQFHVAGRNRAKRVLPSMSKDTNTFISCAVPNFDLTTRKRCTSIVVCVAACLLTLFQRPSSGFVITETFDDNPGWEAVGNGIPPNDFGYSAATNHADGNNVGEIGGTFVRSGQAYYATDIGDLDPSVEALGWSGIGRIVTANNGNSILAWFDKDSSLGWPPTNAIMLRTDEDDLYLRYGANGTSSEVLLASFVTEPFQFTVNYDPDANGGSGAITGTVNTGNPVTLNLLPGHKNAFANLDRFGLMTLFIPGNGSAADVFFDDITYGTKPVSGPSRGDFDFDGDIDLDDFAIFRTNFLTRSALGDMDFDDDVDLIDFRLFKNEYEAFNANSPALKAKDMVVPELASGTLLLLGTIVLCGRLGHLRQRNCSHVCKKYASSPT